MPINSRFFIKLFRHIGFADRLLSALRNTLILSCLLGLGFLFGLLPTNALQQYVFVLINGLSGLFILVSTVLLNKKINLRLSISSRSSKRY